MWIVRVVKSKQDARHAGEFLSRVAPAAAGKLQAGDLRALAGPLVKAGLVLDLVQSVARTTIWVQRITEEVKRGHKLTGTSALVSPLAARMMPARVGEGFALRNLRCLFSQDLVDQTRRRIAGKIAQFTEQFHHVIPSLGLANFASRIPFQFDQSPFQERESWEQPSSKEAPQSAAHSNIG